MGRAKLPRKSTTVDMTAMCDVAFLLLSFFILATKTKPPEAVKVVIPSSVSTKKVDAKDKVTVTIGKDGKVFLAFDDKAKRKQIITDLNTRFSLGIDADAMAKTDQVEIIGTSMSQMKDFLKLPKDKQQGNLLPGIPVLDSTNNELKHWMESAASVYSGEKMNLLVKGDGLAKYPVFKSVIDAFKKNDLMKFNIITNQEGLDKGSALYKEKSAQKTSGN
ncbi:MAG: biopolymer transporter ExbD [Chitinophagaceae bacterium]